MYDSAGTFAFRLTPNGVGAIAVIVVSGPKAEGIVGTLTRRTEVQGVGTLVRARLLSPNSNEGAELDDALVIRTGPDRFELHVHGGMAVVSAVMGALAHLGAEQIALELAGECGFFGKGLQAEILLALPCARTATGMHLLSRQATDGLARWARKWSVWLEAHGDESERMVNFQSAVLELIERSAALMRLLVPARVAIIGAPNAGKSTLANALLGRPVAITSDIAGTTRDWVDASAVLTCVGSSEQSALIQVPVVLVDTAGVRMTADDLEMESIARTRHQADSADVLIVLMDGSQPITSETCALLEQYVHRNPIMVLNKSDLPQRGHIELTDPIRTAKKDGPTPQPVISISARSGHNLEALMSAIVHQLDLQHVDPSEPFAFTEQHLGLLQQLARARDANAARRLLSDWTVIP